MKTMTLSLMVILMALNAQAKVLCAVNAESEQGNYSRNIAVKEFATLTDTQEVYDLGGGEKVFAGASEKSLSVMIANVESKALSAAVSDGKYVVLIDSAHKLAISCAKQ